MGYVFVGKLSLFPVVLVVLGLLSAILLLHGNHSYSRGYFDSGEWPYGVAGLVLFLFSAAIVTSLLLYIVIDVSFQFDSNVFTITKRGVFRSTTLEFSTNHSQLMYYRTHFSEERAWMQLVVKEHDVYYMICSWRGRGEQRDRFLRLFHYLRHQLSSLQASPPDLKRTPYEIVSKGEVTLIFPFTQRLRELGGKIVGEDVLSQRYNRRRMVTRTARQSLCVDDLTTINYDTFFNHFKVKKMANFGGGS